VSVIGAAQLRGNPVVSVSNIKYIGENSKKQNNVKIQSQKSMSKINVKKNADLNEYLSL
jgi:hypothetical protein